MTARSSAPDTGQAEVLARLGDPGFYPDAPADVERIDTHSAHVFLAGTRAYKVKRAVRYSFLDFSTLELRRQACEAELRLNRRTAPSLYLRVMPIARDASGQLALGGAGTPVEWAVVMQRFPDTALLDRMAAAGRFSRSEAVRLADHIAAFHARAVPTPHQGGVAGLREVVEDNARALADVPDVLDPARVQAVTRAWNDAVERLGPLLEARRAGGFVRQCHGDLHLRNIVMLDGAPTLFDAIEFNDAFACIDVWYDVAFLLMDLLARGLAVEANVLFNQYLLRTSDVGGLPLLPLFLSSRAAVRAKTSLASAALEGDATRRAEFEARARDYLALAVRCAADAGPPRLIAIGGRSGVGKSTLAAELAPLVGAPPGAVVLRSDVLRKVLRHHEPEERLGADAYTDAVTAAVYHVLGVRATDLLRGGATVIVDATFLSPASREAIEAVAARAGVACAGVWLDAPADTMAARLRGRGRDASDATVEVLQLQLARDAGPIHWARFEAGPDPAGLAGTVRASVLTG